MKILVNEMPYFLGECPFYDYSTCKLDGEHCEQFDPPCGERNLEECPHLMTLEAHKKKEETKA